MPVGACGDYGVLASGGDYYFYGYNGKLVGHEKRDGMTIIACESFDPSFVLPTEACHWVSHCSDVDLSKARRCPSEVGHTEDAGQRSDGSTHLDAGEVLDATTSLDAVDARSTHNADAGD
jgi:hypothetical protein